MSLREPTGTRVRGNNLLRYLKQCFSNEMVIREAKRMYSQSAYAGLGLFSIMKKNKPTHTNVFQHTWLCPYMRFLKFHGMQTLPLGRVLLMRLPPPPNAWCLPTPRAAVLPYPCLGPHRLLAGDLKWPPDRSYPF